MKQLFSLVGAGIVGGLITFGGIFLFQPGQIAHQPAQIDTPAKFVNYSPEKAPALPFDFALAAERATPSVVHITSISNPSKASSGKESPVTAILSGSFSAMNGLLPLTINREAAQVRV